MTSKGSESLSRPLCVLAQVFALIIDNRRQSGDLHRGRIQCLDAV